MRDFMYLGETPSEEPCVQVGVGGGDGGYTNAVHMRQEQQVMIRYLRRLFGLEPQGAALKIRPEQYDFGELLTIVCEYRDDEPRSVEYAFRLEREYPAWWDERARMELVVLGIYPATQWPDTHPAMRSSAPRDSSSVSAGDAPE